MARTPLPTILLAALLGGCCLDEPDLCASELIADAGPGNPCWAAGRAPLRTTATVQAPVDPGLLGCHVVDGGWCLAGLLGDEGARFSLRHHAPAGVWTTTARGHGCPGAACAREVGRAQAHIGPRSPLVVNHPAEVEYTLSCAALPGRPPLPMARDPGSDAMRPAWLVECLDGQPLRLDPLANGRWSIDDARPDPVVVEGGRLRRVTGVERAGWVAQFLACTQRVCAAANTWDEPWRDPDRDGVQSRCDVCPERPDPGQPDGDGDRIGDACDLCPDDFDPWQTDGDGDRRGDVCDVCPEAADPEQADGDSDGVGDVCDVCPARADPWQPDGDGDGVGDRCDVCPDAPDPAQPDGDGDGAGDVCDVCPETNDPEQTDTDEDGDGDACDDDDDDDGLSDEDEEEAETDPLNPDSDDDGHLDGEDNCPSEANPGQEDADDPSNDEGDACDLPQPPEEHHPDMPPTAGQIVWADALPLTPDRSIGRIVFDYATRFVGHVAAGYFAAGPQMIADVPAVPGDDDPPVEPDPPELPDVAPPMRRSGWEWVERLVQDLEDHTGRTVGIVLGRAYEQWAGDTYCHSNAHRAAFERIGEDPNRACMREVRVGRTNLDFDNPQPLMGMMKRRLRNGLIRVYRFERHRRHDCYCDSVPGVIPPLSEEYKASRSQRPQFRRRYREWLIGQCRDYRFSLALLYQRAFPHMGSLRDVYRRLNDSMRRGRPTLLYRLFKDTAAMRGVLDACRFAEIPEDTGLMPEFAVAARRSADPERPTNQSQWRINRPGWIVPPDGVVGCDGGLIHHYVGWGCPVAGAGLTATEHFAQCPPEDRELGLFTRCAPHEGLEIDEDPFTRPSSLHFEPGFNGPGLHIIDTPVCPPEHMSIQSAQVWASMAGVDRLRNRADPDGFFDYFDRYAELHYWGLPLWIGAERSPDIVQLVQRGQWVMPWAEVYLDHGIERMGPHGDPLSPADADLPVLDGVVGVPERRVDPDEARDACFD